MIKKTHNTNAIIWAISLLLIGAALAIFIKFEYEKAAYIGDWLAGFASSLAFLWIIAGFYLQSAELRLQREELKLQREALKLQTEEFKDLNKYQSLEHIRKIISDAETKLGKNPNELLSIILTPTTDAKDIFNSNDPTKVMKASTAYLKQYTPVLNFMEDYSAALQLYLDSKQIPYLRKEKDRPSAFLIYYINHAKNVPYLSRNFVFISKSAELLFSMERIFSSLTLATMVASEQAFNKNLMKEDAIQVMYDDLVTEFEGDETLLPSIARKHYSKSKK